ncbi:MAG: anthrone oxygenase family protein [Ginsengibacter sp.]
MMTVSNVVLVMTTTCTALMAGLFYSYSCSVVVGLKLLNDPGYIAGMQAINRAIQNPVFFTSFFGTLLLLPVSTYLNYYQHPPLRFWLLLMATIIYVTGAFGVTVLGNIPLNNALEQFNLTSATADAIRLQRSIFESRWNTLNAIRSVSSILSLILVIIACIYADKSHLGILK